MCRAAKFADGGAPNPKRQRTAGYTAKSAGYSLKQTSLVGGQPGDATGEVCTPLFPFAVLGTC